MDSLTAAERSDLGRHAAKHGYGWSGRAGKETMFGGTRAEAW
jgi:hypothetical protein